MADSIELKSKEDLIAVIKGMQEETKALRTQVDEMSESNREESNSNEGNNDDKTNNKEDKQDDEPSEEEIDEVDKLLSE